MNFETDITLLPRTNRQFSEAFLRPTLSAQTHLVGYEIMYLMLTTFNQKVKSFFDFCKNIYLFLHNTNNYAQTYRIFALLFDFLSAV